MRSFLIILATIVVMGAAFFIYLWTEGGNVRGSAAEPVRRLAPASKPADAPDANQLLGPGEGAWMRMLDERSGEISQEFRAAKWDPQRDGTIKVSSPEARFYLGGTTPRQLLVIRGVRGRVVVPDSGKRSPQNMRASAEAPRSGDLQDVTIELYNSPDDTSPSLVCKINNASLVNVPCRIYTESFKKDGKLIAGDQVPVTVRGIDYAFDVRGLEIQLN